MLEAVGTTELLALACAQKRLIEAHRPDDALRMMLPYVGNPSARVRRAVTQALEFSTHVDGVHALIDLCGDADANVRNWATFFLGAREPEDAFFDKADVVEALFARIDDPHEETRAEGILGLAKRRDTARWSRFAASWKRPRSGNTTSKRPAAIGR